MRKGQVSSTHLSQTTREQSVDASSHPLLSKSSSYKVHYISQHHHQVHGLNMNILLLLEQEYQSISTVQIMPICGKEDPLWDQACMRARYSHSSVFGSLLFPAIICILDKYRKKIQNHSESLSVISSAEFRMCLLTMLSKTKQYRLV